MALSLVIGSLCILFILYRIFAFRFRLLTRMWGISSKFESILFWLYLSALLISLLIHMISAHDFYVLIFIIAFGIAAHIFTSYLKKRK